MNLHTIEIDYTSGLCLLRDGSDPRRYYVQQRNRRDLIAIGDESLARNRFESWCERRAKKVSGLPVVDSVAEVFAAVD